jgi:hypothetical protein
MSHVLDDLAHRTLARPQPALSALPSELRKLIVAHLAPNPQDLRPGSKQDLRNANLVHPCLREWVRISMFNLHVRRTLTSLPLPPQVPEYMFRDMALKHVLVGMSSHLERFTVSPANSDLIKLVKHIVVQVRPSRSNTNTVLIQAGSSRIALGNRHC